MRALRLAVVAALALGLSGGLSEAAKGPRKPETPFSIHVFTRATAQEAVDSTNDVRKAIEEKKRDWFRLTERRDEADIVLEITGRSWSRDKENIVHGRLTTPNLADARIIGQAIPGILDLHKGAWRAAAENMAKRVENFCRDTSCGSGRGPEEARDHGRHGQPVTVALKLQDRRLARIPTGRRRRRRRGVAAARSPDGPTLAGSVDRRARVQRTVRQQPDGEHRVVAARVETHSRQRQRDGRGPRDPDFQVVGTGVHAAYWLDPRKAVFEKTTGPAVTATSTAGASGPACTKATLAPRPSPDRP